MLRFELLSDYEAVAQYRVLKYDAQNLDLDHKEILRDKNYLFYQIIKNNFWDYLKLSLSHYIGNWSIGNKNNFLEKEKKSIPNISELINSSGPMNLPNKKLIMLAQIFFIALFIALVIHSLLVFKMAILRSEDLKREDLLLILLIQIYLLAVSFSNISTPRYLMAIYPFLLIICTNFFSLIKKMINENNRKDN